MVAVIAGECFLGVIGLFLIVSSVVSLVWWSALEKKGDATALDTPIPQNRRPALRATAKPDSRGTSVD
jgi:hypothetical protein